MLGLWDEQNGHAASEGRRSGGREALKAYTEGFGWGLHDAVEEVLGRGLELERGGQSQQPSLKSFRNEKKSSVFSVELKLQSARQHPLQAVLSRRMANEKTDAAGRRFVFDRVGGFS